MASTPDSILKDLKNKKYAPVYFLQGDEPYYIDVISDYIEKNCLNLLILDNEEGYLYNSISICKYPTQLYIGVLLQLKPVELIIQKNKCEKYKQNKRA